MYLKRISNKSFYKKYAYVHNTHIPLTVSLQDVSLVPKELVALQMYSPASSGNTSLIFSVANLFLYFKSKTLDELIV